MIIKDNLRYVDERYSSHSWQMRNDHILELFGLPSSYPIPADYKASRQIGNVMVYIYPRGVAKKEFGVNRRVVASCPKCYRMICAGHLDQHLKNHK
jgi:hypothetical protein